jgi:hypothetical protein
MRSLLALALLLGACSVADDFSMFSFDGGGGGSDGSGGNAFGAACTANSCMQYNASRTVSCITSMGGLNFKDGICTRVCTPGTGACSEFPDAVCAPVGPVTFCLETCTGGGTPCRSGYDCCVNKNKADNGQAGACAPSGSQPLCN